MIMQLLRTIFLVLIGFWLIRAFSRLFRATSSKGPSEQKRAHQNKWYNVRKQDSFTEKRKEMEEDLPEDVEFEEIK